jgi:hypothetical protein
MHMHAVNTIQVRRRFRRFLQTFQEEGSAVPVHETLIKDMCAANKASLEASHSYEKNSCSYRTLLLYFHSICILSVQLKPLCVVDHAISRAAVWLLTLTLTAVVLCCCCMHTNMQVSYLHLSKAVPILAIWLADAPKDMLELMDEVYF